jgi:hypothetical protein
MVVAPLCDGCEHTPHNRDGVMIMCFFTLKISKKNNMDMRRILSFRLILDFGLIFYVFFETINWFNKVL